MHIGNLASFEDSSDRQGEVPSLDKADEVKKVSPDYNVHIFYYPWYGNPRYDNGTYLHWNHEYLPHWNKEEDKKWPKGRHHAPGDIGANFYPSLGAYSSRDPVVIEQHMKWIRQTRTDSQGCRSFDEIIPAILDAAERSELKVALHIEPYEGRNVSNLKSYFAYITDKYGSHPAYYKLQHEKDHQFKPVYYVYDSYLIADKEWKTLLSIDGSISVRNTNLDAVFLGLLVEDKDKTKILSAGFDGFYTYFAAQGFTYGSTWPRWRHLQTFARKNRVLFVPCVGPGYIDERVRPWNFKNTKSRETGAYYGKSWQAALEAGAGMVGITSFNEWHEGTQIEPAVPKRIDEFQYLDYTPHDPDFYLSLTKEWVDRFSVMQKEKRG